MRNWQSQLAWRADSALVTRTTTQLFAQRKAGASLASISALATAAACGTCAQEALQKFTSDPVNFRTTLKQLAASLSRSAETVAL